MLFVAPMDGNVNLQGWYSWHESDCTKVERGRPWGHGWFLYMYYAMSEGGLGERAMHVSARRRSWGTACGWLYWREGHALFGHRGQCL